MLLESLNIPLNPQIMQLETRNSCIWNLWDTLICTKPAYSPHSANTCTALVRLSWMWIVMERRWKQSLGPGWLRTVQFLPSMQHYICMHATKIEGSSLIPYTISIFNFTYIKVHMGDSTVTRITLFCVLSHFKGCALNASKASYFFFFCTEHTLHSRLQLGGNKNCLCSFM